MHIISTLDYNTKEAQSTDGDELLLRGNISSAKFLPVTKEILTETTFPSTTTEQETFDTTSSGEADEGPTSNITVNEQGIIGNNIVAGNSDIADHETVEAPGSMTIGLSMLAFVIAEICFTAILDMNTFRLHFRKARRNIRFLYRKIANVCARKR